ncbi:ABC transporter ATP-binding protein [Alteribacter keqinensis]|uniref:ABC transporter ATP-binding protein n=1 Tax=Alteribacter keqinensis TaxID=2483800 RepID=A0A3M7TXX9_9BACI|nr:ABC transporter ATP-binding protein [Alteribacter keqinensis]RNA70129.1 ABC transporter ATP-binding protein [Alteribacter keqinensis]
MTINVQAQGVSVQNKEFSALSNVSFSLDPGKIYGLIGRNGAGKTTLLSLLASYQEPDRGKIKIDGENPFENERIMPQVTFIYNTKDNDHEYDTGREYLELAMLFRPDFDMDYANELAALFKLPLDKPLGKLSSGMQSALNVTIGLASRSPVTIFDEAYLGMDAPTRDLFYKEVLEEQARHQRTIILSTHLVSEMEYLFDEVLILHKGKLIAHEPIEDLISKGFSVTGASENIDVFVKDLKTLSTQRLGGTKSVMIYGSLSEQQLANAQRAGLEIGSVSLHDLFIQLTKDEEGK